MENYFIEARQFQDKNIQLLHKTGITITREEETALFNAYKKETNKIKKQTIKDRIFKANIRFAIQVSLKYKNMPKHDMNDIVASAMAGLLIAIDKFDTSKDVKFISYAVWYIDMKIKDYITDNELIRVPYTPKMQYMKGRFDEDQSSDIQNVANVLTGIISINSPINNNNDDFNSDTIADVIPDTNFIDSVEYDINTYDIKNVISTVIDSFTLDDQYIIKTYFGIGMDQKDMSDIGNDLGVSRERIRQIKNTLISKIKNAPAFKKVMQNA